MSNFMKRKIARESIESDVELDGLTNVEQPEENLETQLSELADEDSQLDQLMTDGDVLAEDTEVAERHVEIAERAEEDGEELSETAAAAIEVAQESIRRRWAISSPRVARESFRAGRGATRVATESWKDTLKDLWKRFLELVQAAIDKGHDLLLKITNVGKSAVARSKKYEKAIDNLGSKKKDEISGGFVTKLAMDGKFEPVASMDTAKALVTGGKAKAMAEAAGKMIVGAAKYSVVAADGQDPKVVDLDGKEVSLPSKVSGKIKTLPGLEPEEGGTTSYSVMALPGNNYIQYGKKELNVAEGKSDFHTVVVFLAAGDQADETTAKTPTGAELRAANGALKSIGEGYEKILKDFRSLNDNMKKAKSEVQKAVDKFDRSKEENRDYLRNARTIAQDALRSCQATNKAVHTTVRNVISGLSGYIGAGIAAYERKSS